MQWDRNQKLGETQKNVLLGEEKFNKYCIHIILWCRIIHETYFLSHFSPYWVLLTAVSCCLFQPVPVVTSAWFRYQWQQVLSWTARYSVPADIIEDSLTTGMRIDHLAREVNYRNLQHKAVCRWFDIWAKVGKLMIILIAKRERAQRWNAKYEVH